MAKGTSGGKGALRVLQRVSIVARGRGLGQSMVSTENERVLLTRSEMETELAIAMAGIAAEEMMFSESSTTSEDDIEKASALAREMVGRYGMSVEVGRVQLLAASNGYLGGESTVVDSVSGHTMQQFDAEVKSLLAAAEHRAGTVLTSHREHLEKLADSLETQETLEGATLERLLSGVRPEVFGLLPDAGGRTPARGPGRKPRQPAKG